MKKRLKVITTIFLMALSAGCIAEDYDFTPPSVTLSSSDSSQSEKLTEANIKWTGENSKLEEKRIDDVLSYANEQEQLTFQSGQKIDLLFDSEDFMVEDLEAALWKDGTEQELLLDKQRSFTFPEEKGEYILVVELDADSGLAQYVGNIEIK
ncbi:hypothetical protein [Metabacillus indicus]|uniref:hypothetical protein n=1 Tax=Metabacillus indicus TaxID=246786 RepID=UPI002491C45F|nr:hypothetical protein [Metabacillus indicus]